MILINGQVGETISVMDRGLMYGDGVFRTMRVRGGKILNWPAHYRKLTTDCRALDLACPAQSLLEQDLHQLTAAVGDGVIKIVITRGSGGRGYAPPPTPLSTRIVLTTSLPDYPVKYWEAGVALHLCQLRLSLQPRLAGIKHLSRLENVLARSEWQDPNVPEGLLLNAREEVIEGTMSNIFIRKDNTLITPNLAECGVAGLQRERILTSAPRLAYVSQVGTIKLNDVLNADEVFICNSVIGVWPVRQIGTRSLSVGPAAVKLHDLLENDPD